MELENKIQIIKELKTKIYFDKLKLQNLTKEIENLDEDDEKRYLLIKDGESFADSIDGMDEALEIIWDSLSEKEKQYETV